MKYRMLGKTGMNVSALSFGASAIGGVFRKVYQKESIRTVHAVLDAGINYLDVSPAYGTHESEFGVITAEVVLGRALREIPRDRYYLASKAGKMSHIPLRFDFSYDFIIRSAEESMKRLNVDYLDVLQLHDIEYENEIHLEQALDEGIAALKKLKEQGKIRFYGITAYPVQFCKRILAEAEVDTILCHNHYSLNDTLLLDLLPEIKRTGVGLINASPLSSGLLSTRGVGNWHPATKDDLAVFRRAAEFCEENHTFIERLAIQFSTGNEYIPTTLVSSSNRERMLNNIKWSEEKCDKALIEKVREILSSVMNKPWIIG